MQGKRHLQAEAAKLWFSASGRSEGKRAEREQQMLTLIQVKS